jgi:hypothetical protein
MQRMKKKDLVELLNIGMKCKFFENLEKQDRGRIMFFLLEA